MGEEAEGCGSPDSFAVSGTGIALLLSEIVGRHGRSLRFRARGPSMWPFIQDGDMVRVSPLNGMPLGLGDVAALIHPVSGKLLLHRVVGRRDEGIMIKADRLIGFDGVFSSERIVGRVTEVEREGRPVIVGLGPERRWIARGSRMIGAFYGVLHGWVTWVCFGK